MSTIFNNMGIIHLVGDLQKVLFVYFYSLDKTNLESHTDYRDIL